MPTTITTAAQEESTYIITCAFTDEDGAAVVPGTVTWTLMDSDGTVINSREDVSATPASSVDVVLSGDDLQVLSGETANEVKRVFLVEYVYDSNAGNNLPGKDHAIFVLENLTGVV